MYSLDDSFIQRKQAQVVYLRKALDCNKQPAHNSQYFLTLTRCPNISSVKCELFYAEQFKRTLASAQQTFSSSFDRSVSRKAFWRRRHLVVWRWNQTFPLKTGSPACNPRPNLPHTLTQYADLKRIRAGRGNLPQPSTGVLNGPVIYPDGAGGRERSRKRSACWCSTNLHFVTQCCGEREAAAASWRAFIPLSQAPARQKSSMAKLCE